LPVARVIVRGDRFNPNTGRSTQHSIAWLDPIGVLTINVLFLVLIATFTSAILLNVIEIAEKSPECVLFATMY
jgi:hypothetical protein